MVRPTQELQVRVLTDVESLSIGDGTDTGDDGIDFDGGAGTGGGSGSGVITPPAAEIVEVVEASGDDVDLDFDVANWWDITLTADCTFTISNPPGSGTVGILHVILRQGTGAPWTATWPAEVEWPDTDGTDGGAAPILNVVEGARDVVTLLTEDGGTSYGGNHDSGTGTSGEIAAEDVTYDNLTSELDAVNVQDAIDELAAALGFSVTTVGSISDNSVSATTVINDTTWNEFPGAIRLDASRVLIVYRGDGTDHITDGKLCGQILTLGAARDTVSAIGARFTILDASNDLRCEDGVSIIDDQIVIAYREYTGTANTAPQLLICDDAPADFTSGSTWGSPISVPLTTGSVQNYTQGHVHKLADGSYILGVGWQSAGTHSVGVAKWTGTVNNPAAASFVTVGSGAADYAEIAILETSSGNVRALMRSVTNTDIRTATSTNSGTSWSSVTVAYDGYGYPTFRKLLSTLYLTVYRDAPNGDTAWRSSSDGITWGSETILDTTGTRSAYATLLQTTPNDILCVYAVEYSADGSTGTADIFYQWFADSSVFSAGVAPTTADYLVGTANATLTNEIVVGTTPGGELGGTWASPTVDVTHSGSAHVPLGSAVPLAASGSGAAGSSGSSSHEDHIHPSSSSSGGGGEILISDTPAGSPLIFADLIQNEAQDDLVYADT